MLVPLTLLFGLALLGVSGVAGISGRAIWEGGAAVKGLGAVPESGVKNGEVGLRAEGEKLDFTVSVKEVCSEVALCE